MLLTATCDTTPVEILPGQDELIELTTEAIGFYRGEELDIVDHTVTWSRDVCPTNAALPTAVVYRGACFHGLTFTCHRMYVAVRDPIESSALTHEYGHCVLLTLDGDADGDHSDTEFWQLVDGITR